MHHGIIVATDQTLEHLLPIFYLNLRLHSRLPITFFDFGMSAQGRCFCEKRGPVIPIEDSLLTQKGCLKKTMWFKKPLAFKQAPYDMNLWLDLDCKVRGPLEPLFEKLKEPQWLAIFEEPTTPVKDCKHFNSGVVVFFKHSPFISLWEDLCLQFAEHLPGDQDALSVLLTQTTSKIFPLRYGYNHLFKYTYKLPFQDSHIIHYHGPTKTILTHELGVLQSHKLLKLSSPDCPAVSRTWLEVLV